MIIRSTNLYYQMISTHYYTTGNDGGRFIVRLSPNDLMFVTPKVQVGFFSILLQFRKHKFVLATDIALMYRQVLVSSEQRPLQRILWRDNPTKPLSLIELNSVTYDTALAAFLAMCL